ncbi:mast cell carboxypeptidase A [Echinops telfairi]|uniref:Mast cell carboxypeptidase A n=1 Tax=Echinops telfairi TaxID=9371 RepID=A0ABM0ZRV0_ECHTE|nr:mast cell carboxypeptidase A [Echinops telfairi]
MRLLLSVSLIAAALAMAPVRFDREKVFRVKLTDEKQATIIKDLAKAMELDFWYPDATHHVTANMTVDFRAREEDAEAIKTAMERNQMHYMPCQPQSGPSSESSPSCTGAKGVGKQDERKTSIFMDCGIHAREWISPAFCQWFVYQATKSYGKNKIMTKLLDQMNFYVLPVFNVDGYIWSWTKNRLWRKNRSKNENSKCVGTDLNRNFNVSWNSFPNTRNPCQDVYRGAAPESEKETKAVSDFIRSHLPSLKAYITFHSYSQMLLFPYGYTHRLAPDHESLNKVAKIGAEALATRYETRYIYGPIASTIYPTSGSSLDWAYDVGIKHTFAFELRDKGKFGFLLPESQIKSTCKETMLAVKFIAKYILKHAC